MNDKVKLKSAMLRRDGVMSITVEPFEPDVEPSQPRGVTVTIPDDKRVVREPVTYCLDVLGNWRVVE